MLRKVLGHATLDNERLSTIIFDNEAVINSRLLFLIDRVDHGVPDCDAINRSALTRKLRYQQRLRNELLRRGTHRTLRIVKSFLDQETDK